MQNEFFFKLKFISKGEKGEDIVKKTSSPNKLAVEDLENKNLTLNVNTSNLKNFSKDITRSSSNQSSLFHYSLPKTPVNSSESNEITTPKQRSTSINNLSRNVLKNYTSIAASISSSLIPTNTLFINQKLNNVDSLNQASKQLRPSESSVLSQTNLTFSQTRGTARK